MDIQEETQKNIEALKNAAGTDIVCPICHKNQFAVINGYLRHDIQTELNSFSIGGPGIQTVALICKNCGFLSQHVLSVLRKDMGK